MLVLLAPALRIAVRCAHAGERVYLSPCLRVWVGHALRMHGSCFVNAGGGNVCGWVVGGRGERVYHPACEWVCFVGVFHASRNQGGSGSFCLILPCGALRELTKSIFLSFHPFFLICRKCLLQMIIYLIHMIVMKLLIILNYLLPANVKFRILIIFQEF